ncbi:MULTISPECIES: TorF family putative porin [unclassified Acinetobacter]|uniref:TorF family putative porin n=1 Tax=unclassified Acinetobacter TaxID=196816 RepID=UPI003AF6EAAF
MNSLISKLLWAIPICIASCPAFAQQANVLVKNGMISGNVGLVSKYIYRGGIENDDVAVQGGLSYAHKSGITFGYWGSTLSYNPTDVMQDHGFENNFYLAYAQEVAQNWSYNLRTTAYVYHKGGTIYADQADHRKTTYTDLSAELSYKNLTAGASVMLADASSANAGDIYLSIAYRHALAQDFIFNTSIGASLYNSHRDDSIVQTEQDFTLSEMRLGLSKTIANTGVTASLDYVIGGKDRLGEGYKDNMLFGLAYSF